MFGVSRRGSRKFKVLLLTFIFTMIGLSEAIASVYYDYTIDEASGRRVFMPLAYEVEDILIFEIDGQPLREANKLFLDQKGMLFIVDSGNHRVIKSDKSGNVKDVFLGPEESMFFHPGGIFVDEAGRMYVADTQNSRIVLLSPEGEFLKEFGEFDSPLLGDNFLFQPTNVAVTPIGHILTTDGHRILTIDENNEFRGFVGSLEVGFDLRRSLIRMFATDVQRERIAREMPHNYSNIRMYGGIIYATVTNTNSNQIIALNSVGRNVFPDGTFGEFIDDEGNRIVPNFVDVAVDKNGIVYALEQVSGKIYQYTSQGDLLAVFGGRGNRQGQFDTPSSLVVDNDGNVYVLDRMRNNIQVFKPTNYIRTVHEAVIAYDNGEYERAKALWEEVLRMNATYSLAHKGIAQAHMEERNWSEAMIGFQEAGYMRGYSEAFTRNRLQFVRDNFVLILFASVLIFVLSLKILFYLIKRARALVDRYIKWQGGFET